MFPEASYKTILRRLRWSELNQPLSGPAWVSCFPRHVSQPDGSLCWRPLSTWNLHQSYLAGSPLKIIAVESEHFYMIYQINLSWKDGRDGEQLLPSGTPGPTFPFSPPPYGRLLRGLAAFWWSRGLVFPWSDGPGAARTLPVNKDSFRREILKWSQVVATLTLLVTTQGLLSVFPLSSSLLSISPSQIWGLLTTGRQELQT